MKYIMYRVGDKHYPIIFPEALVHAQVADRMNTLLQFQKAELVSAGEINVVAISTTGESTSLDVKADEKDRMRVNCMDYSHGIDTPMDEGIEKLVFEALDAGLNDL